MNDTDPRMETWDRYWREERPAYPPHDILIKQITENVESKDFIIMEIGAGSGIDAMELARAGYAVIVTDISVESLRYIRSKSNKAGIEVMAVMADALRMPFKISSIDFIYHQGLLEHFKNPHSLLSESRAVLKPKGKVLVDVPQTFTFYTLKKKWAMARGRWFAGWETQYTPARLRRVLKKAGYEVKVLYGRDYEFAPFVWLRDIRTLGKTRFGHPIIPRFISVPIGALWTFFEKRELSNYFKLCIGAVAGNAKDRN